MSASHQYASGGSFSKKWKTNRVEPQQPFLIERQTNTQLEDNSQELGNQDGLESEPPTKDIRSRNQGLPGNAVANT